MQRIPTIYYAPSTVHGRGVFSGQDLSKGDLIEICPVLILGPEESRFIKTSELFNYYFVWGDKGDAFAIALGYGSLYNHAFDPNVEFVPRFAERTIAYYCMKEVRSGEELFINYVSGGKRSDLWFKPV